MAVAGTLWLQSLARDPTQIAFDHIQLGMSPNEVYAAITMQGGRSYHPFKAEEWAGVSYDIVYYFEYTGRNDRYARILLNFDKHDRVVGKRLNKFEAAAERPVAKRLLVSVPALLLLLIFALWLNLPTQSWLVRWRWWVLAAALAVATAGIIFLEIDSRRRDTAFAEIRVGMRRDEAERLLARACAEELDSVNFWPPQTTYRRGRHYLTIGWGRESVLDVRRDIGTPRWLDYLRFWFRRARESVGL